MASIRKTVSKTLYQYAQQDENIVALTADLAESVGFDLIRDNLPKQFVECGIAEQELLGIATGFALSGKKPFAGSYSAFHPGRNWDQLRNSVCYNNTPVRLISSHYGLSVGGDGATHQCLEYLALTLPLPNLRVLMPFNSPSSVRCVDILIEESFYASCLFQPRADHDESFDSINTDSIGEDGYVYIEHEDEAKTLIITCGIISSEAYKVFLLDSHACDIVFVVDFSNINKEKLAKTIYRYGHIVILEEHQQFGGLGNVVFEIMAIYKIAREINHICINSTFGKSARDHKELWDKYRLSSRYIAQAIK
jgi:transketolase